MTLWNPARLFFSLPDRLWPVGRAAAAKLISSIVVITITLSVPGWAQTDDFSSLAASAEAARQQGDIARAIELYGKATTKNPNWPDGWWFLGVLQYDQNQYEFAREALSHYIQLTPKAAPALALRGICEFNTRAYEQALQDLETADSLGAANQPKNTRIIYYHEALLLTYFGQFEEALSKFQLLTQQGADTTSLELPVGLAGMRQRMLPNAVETSQASFLAAVGHATILLMRKDYEAGRQAFQSLFSQNPRLSNLHYLYGYLLFPTNPDTALEQFQQELAISPRNANAHAMRAWTLELQGDYAHSLDDAAKAAAEDPSLPMAQLVYGKALVETGSLTSALPYLEHVLASQPENLEAHLALVKAYSKLGRSDDARRERLACLAISQQGAASVAAP